MKLAWIALILVFCPPALATALVVSAAQGTSTNVPWDYTGNGLGFGMGFFEINNPHTAGLILHGITTSALGSGDDSAGLSEIGLFTDTNGNGVYNPGADDRYGQIYTAYPADNGTLTFTESVGFAPGETKRFLIVGKLNGVVPASYNNAFHTIVDSISATGGVPIGLPTTFIRGAAAANHPTPLMLEYDVTGTGSPYDYSFRLVLDNHDGSWSSGQDWRLPFFGQAPFWAGGTAPFASWTTNAASFPVGPYNSTSWASYTHAGVSYDCPCLIDTVTPVFEPWIPNSVGDQLVWWGTANVFLNEGEMSWSIQRVGTLYGPGAANIEPAHRVGDYLRVDAESGIALVIGPADTGGGSGFALGAFEILSHTNAAAVSIITIDASGTGDDSSAFSDIRLFVDTNSNGAFDSGVDTQFGGSFTAYPADDGQLTFNGTLNFNPNETKRLMVVAMLNGSTLATYGQTFNTTVTAISASGNMHSGLPTVVMPGIHIQAPTLTLATTGYAASVPANAQGPGGIGVPVAEFLLSNNSVGTANLDSITVDAAGAVFDQTDFSFVALYQDTNGNGVYDAGDTLYGAAAGAFPADDGSLTFTQAITFAAAQSRLFFLVVKLSGSATVGADFWCQVSAIGVSGGTETSGIRGELVHCFATLPNTPAGGSGDGGSNDDAGCSSGADASVIWLAWLCVVALFCARSKRRVCA